MTTAHAHPNLALIKYWGKSDTENNLPATSSLGISLEAFETRTSAKFLRGKDQLRSGPHTGELQVGNTRISWEVQINRVRQDPRRFSRFFSNLLRRSGEQAGGESTLNYGHFDIHSSNNFPTAAGLASSASGFAALAGAAAGELGISGSPELLSDIARAGSGSASRSVFPGFVSFPRGSSSASCIHNANHWPELRCLIVRVSEGAKTVSSRDAMEESRKTSPYYPAWLEDSQALYDRAVKAVAQQDLASLGPLIRQSYLRMFSTMFSAADPVIYWQPGSIEIMQLARELRSAGIPVYETMDAGPQVKLITLEDHVPEVESALQQLSENYVWSISAVGGGMTVTSDASIPSAKPGDDSWSQP